MDKTIRVIRRSECEHFDLAKFHESMIGNMEKGMVVLSVDDFLIHITHYMMPKINHSWEAKGQFVHLKAAMKQEYDYIMLILD